MTAKINKKITGYRVKTETQESATPVAVQEPIGMHEAIQRPEVLLGSTYKIKPPHLDNALYVTINDIEIDGVRHPYEIFLNSKNMEQFQWVLSLTRVISAVFRKGGDIKFLATELKEVFDPKGGYLKKGGVYMPSLVAEIGYVLERHLKHIGQIVDEKDQHMEAFIAKKREEVMAYEEGEKAAYPKRATLCSKCNTKAVIIMDGCETCLECGSSKCG